VQRIFFVLLVLNLLLFQLMGTLLVHQSDRRLAVQQRLVLKHGFQPVPGIDFEKKIDSFTSALAGGVFYAVSLGTGLTVMETAVMFILLHPLFSSIISGGAFGILSISFLLYVIDFSYGPPWWTGLFFGLSLLIALVLLMIRKNRPVHSHGLSRQLYGFTAATMAVLALGGWLLGVRDFTSARDILFLFHPVGRAVSDYYYDHTLLAVRPLESAAQRAWLTAAADSRDFIQGQCGHLHTMLLRKGIFLINTPHGSFQELFDISMADTQGSVSFSWTRNPRIRSAHVSPRSDSAEVALERMLKEIDPFAHFKRVLAFSIGMACPLFFLGLSGWLVGRFFLFVSRHAGCKTALGLWAAVTALFLVYTIAGPGKSLPAHENELVGLAWKGNSPQRVRAARRLELLAEQKQLKESLLSLTTSPDFRVRMWAARGLGRYSGSEVEKALVMLSRDEHITVVTSAISALSRLPGEKGKDTLIKLSVRHYRSYVRDSAFRELKRHGWLKKGYAVQGGAL